MKPKWLSVCKWKLLCSWWGQGAECSYTCRCVSDREEALTLTLHGAITGICIAVAGRGDLTLMATWRVELGCISGGLCSVWG